MGTTATKIPSFCSTPSKADPQLKRLLEAVVEVIEIRLGRRGDPRDRAITLRELIDSGLAKELRDKPFDPDAGTGVTDFAPPPVLTDSTIPSAPTGLSAAGAFTKIILSWDSPQMSNLAYSEVYRGTTDSLGNAVRHDTTQAFVWADTVDPGETYFYWVRHVSTSDILSPFAGSVTATTAKVDASIIQDAVITGQKLVDGAVSAVKIAEDAVTTAKIANDAITTALIDAAAITTTEIADDAISTAKIAANAITASEIAASAVTSNAIAANTIVAGDIAAGTITGTQIAADTVAASNMAANSITASNAALATASVITAKIADAAITNAKINDLAADKITAGTIASARINAASIASNLITAAKIDVDDLFGESITLASGGHIKQGQSDYATGTGFFLGTHSSTTKFSIGNPSGQFLTWDGSILNLHGQLAIKDMFSSNPSGLAVAYETTTTRHTGASIYTGSAASTTWTTARSWQMNGTGTMTIKVTAEGYDGSADEFMAIRIMKNGTTTGTHESGAGVPDITPADSSVNTQTYGAASITRTWINATVNEGDTFYLQVARPEMDTGTEKTEITSVKCHADFQFGRSWATHNAD